MATHKIDKKITSFSVKEVGQADEAPAAVVQPEPTPVVPTGPTLETMHEKISRPEMLVGSTYKIKQPGMDHAMYITINDIILNEGTEYEHRHPFEVFINSKNMEQFQWVVALTRIMSAVFRKGGDVAFIVEEMKAVFDPKGGFFEPGTGRYIPSLIAQIGLVIEDHLKRIGLVKSPELSEAQRELMQKKAVEAATKVASHTPPESVASGFPPNATTCSKCHQKSLVILDGCATCLNCGYSKCG